jgi:hypothetical protein
MSGEGNLRIQNLRAIVRSSFLRLCCLTGGRVLVEISYSDQKGQCTSRTIRPLYPKREVRRCNCGRNMVYGPLKFVAWCEIRKAERQFFPHQMKILGARFS